MGTCRPHRFTTNLMRPGRLGIRSAFLVLLIVSCGSAGRTANALETTDTSAEGVGDGGPEVVLFDFNDESKLTGWTTVNDPVMGGLSTSEITIRDGGLVFSGTISLENNGGFASVRSPDDPDIGARATGAKSIRVHAVGDGQTYVLKLGVAGQRWSHIQRFSTDDAVQRIYELPIEGFEPVDMFLRPAPDAPQTLDPSNISQVSVFILDKQQGPFELIIGAIDAAR